MVVSFLLLVCICPVLEAGVIPLAWVRLGWGPSPSPGVAGYRIHVGTSSGNYTEVIDVGDAYAGTVSNLVVGATYFFAVSAYDLAYRKSPLSAEITYKVAPRIAEGSGILSSIQADQRGEGTQVPDASYKVPPQVAERATGPKPPSQGETGPLLVPDCPVDGVGPRLLLTLNTQSQAVLTGTGPAGCIYNLLVTADLRTWSLLTNLTVGIDGRFRFTDSAGESGARYYRLSPAQQRSTPQPLPD